MHLDHDGAVILPIRQPLNEERLTLSGSIRVGNREWLITVHVEVMATDPSPASQLPSA